MPGTWLSVLRQCGLVVKYMGAGARVSRFKSWLYHFLAWGCNSTYFIELLCQLNYLSIDTMLRIAPGLFMRSLSVSFNYGPVREELLFLFHRGGT